MGSFIRPRWVWGLAIALLALAAWAVYFANTRISGQGSEPLAQSSASVVRLRVLTHGAFDLDKALLAQFEAQEKVKLEILSADDAGEMLNKLILTRQAPIADVVYGLDNLSLAKAEKSGILEPLQNLAPTHYELGSFMAAIDYGAVSINAEPAALAQKGLPVPTRLEDLVKPIYRNTLVMPHPASSSTGLAFLVATIVHFGEDKAWVFWRDMKANGFKVTNGWTQAYQKEFSHNGGSYPLVLSYVSSPAAEVFYGQGKYQEAPTQSLDIPGGVFLQVEGAALIRQTQQDDSARQRFEKAKAFIAFLQSPAVQRDLQTRMWMLPAVKGVERQAALQKVQIPASLVLQKDFEAEKVQEWVQTWTRLMRP